MIKKRIFIAIHYMELGGAEISLLGLLNAIDPSKYNVDLFIYSHRGDFMKLIPGYVNILPEIKEYANIESPMVQCLKEGCFKVLAGRLLAKLDYKVYKHKTRDEGESATSLQMIADRVTPHLPSLNYLGEYDLAVSFLTPHNIVLDKVSARKKIAWIHTDYSYVKVDAVRELKVWSSYDNIISISEKVTESFLKTFPSLSKKIVLIENILSPNFVRQRSKSFNYKYPSGDDCINILSVGRFSNAKNFDNVPEICQKIRKKGMNAYWYLIGFGAEESLIRQKIKENKMEDYVKILGKKENPYPYMVSCDFYIQPSRYEGKSVTVREAQMLGKIVIVTDYPTAGSQISSGNDGVIVPLDNDMCAQGIADVIHDDALQIKIKQYLANHDYGNESEIKKFEKLLEE